MKRGLDAQTLRALARRRYRPVGFQNVWIGGWCARENGEAADACPYRGRGGWGRTWRSVWLDGWAQADAHRPTPRR